MVVCWGKEFTSVESLWRDPKCFVSSPEILAQRLAKFPPEVACNPSVWRVFGQAFKNLWQVSKDSRCEVSYQVLKDRIGRQKMPIYRAVKKNGGEFFTSGGTDVKWKEWLKNNTIESHGCILVTTPQTMEPILLAKIFDINENKKFRNGILRNQCGNYNCINIDHYRLQRSKSGFQKT